ncbi:MAG: flavodoxin domain-containing protein [Porticoccaceae bacterium]|nr:flavodoxin domain-containing protein [Porticoccaceae bacterium]MDG1474408.1 flavodoxin domain-containing protein [Porticoccaceae bacterium]
MTIDQSHITEGMATASNIRVLFGSETGTAEEFAFDLGTALQSEDYACEVTDFDDYTSADLASEELVIVVTSTYGNGEAPYNAEDTYTWLETEQPDLNGLSFTVCALGDTGYPAFAQAGKDFDQFLGDCGAERILPRFEIDACFDEPIEPFIELVKNWLSEHGARFKK